MSHDSLRESVCQANKDIVAAGLVLLTWGNASGVDREAGIMAIKPSGVDYDALCPNDIVLLSLESGETVEGDLQPSSDTATHLHLYQEFSDIGGVVHTHSTHATSWAQAGKDLHCFGTTHADHFYGTVPVTRPLTDEEIETDYEMNTGKVIVERFQELTLTPNDIPGVLVRSHAPFTWGTTVEKAVENSIVLEEVARLNLHSLAINPDIASIPQSLLNKHFLRKHGTKAYYGQKS